jgi:succinate-acetate transporter protein
VIFPLALAYGGIVQLLAGMWAFIRGDTFAAVGFSSYGGFWISFIRVVRSPARATTSRWECGWAAASPAPRCRWAVAVLAAILRDLIAPLNH